MTASREELAALRHALEGALGLAELEGAPPEGRDWRERWASLVEMGVPGCCIPEELGGLGMEATAALTASRVLGAALYGGPYPAAVAAGFALARWLEAGDRERVGEAIAAGECVPAVAYLGASARTAADGDGLTVRGRARVVLGATQCDSFLVLANDDATMAFVEGRDRCSVTHPNPFDVTRSVADVAFEGARGLRVGGGAEARRSTERLYGLLVAGDALGGAERMLERACSYALERRAFGRPIGGFQAVQHRLVDHTIALRGMTLLATSAADALTESGDDALRRVLLAEGAIASGALHVLHDLLQLTGAIGFTWEHGLHLYERRAHVSARLGRNPRAALRALAAGWEDASPEAPRTAPG